MTKEELMHFMVDCEVWKGRIANAQEKSRERSLIVTKLDEARLWASEALALLEDEELIERPH